MAEDPKEFFKRMNEQPNDSATILGETPQNVLLLAGAEDLRRKRTEETQCQRDAQLTLENIHEHRVFFYPGSSADWEPLHRFTHECDTFIFCDWETNPDAVDGNFGVPGLETQLIAPLDEETVSYLADATRIHPRIWRIVKQGNPPSVEPWGKYALLVRSVGNIQRKLHYFYLGIEGVTVFFNLFTPVRAAPHTICLKGIGDFAGNWTNFHDWDRPLGQLVRMCHIKPTYLTAEGGPHESWPYPKLWQRFPDWERSPATYVRKEHEAPIIQAQPGETDAARRVIVKRGRLTPELVQDCEAIVLPISFYGEHMNQWPIHAKILLLAPPDQEGQLPGHAANIHFIGRRHAPLSDILGSITVRCAELGIRRVSSIGIGYEDEGPELDRWRQQPGSPLELTIYCEHEGDVVSFGPYADMIR